MDANDLDRLVRENLDAALRFAVRLSGDVHLAEEIVQDALLRTALAWRSYRGDASFRTWFFRIIVNASRDSARSTRLTETFDKEPVDSGCSDPSGSLEAAEMAALVEASVAKLPDRQREVIVLLAFEGISTSEAAAVLGISEQNVRTTLHLARRRLREQLSRHLSEHRRDEP